MSKLLVQVERVEDLIGRADNYFGCDLCGKDSVDATAFACAEKKKPITNADRIRAMTDEELADLFISIGDGNTPEKMVFSARDMRYERKMWLDWLKQEVKEDE